MEKDIYNTYFGKAYRFIGFEGFNNTIAKGTLRFSRIDTFNDPLDCNPLKHPYAYKIYKKVEPFASKNLKISEINTGFKSWLKDFYEKSYMCCFCKEYDSDLSYLMWAYYGAHKEMCFEIDFNKQSYRWRPSHITYVNDLKSERDLIEFKSSEERGMFIATTKSKIWEHEKEVRLIVDVDNNNVSKNIILSDDKYHLFYPFDIKIISKVIFAVNSDKIKEDKVMHLMESKGHKPIYEKMIINPDTLKLQSIDYESYI